MPTNLGRGAARGERRANFSRGNSGDTEAQGPEVFLWRAVITQAIVDATIDARPRKGKRASTGTVYSLNQIRRRHGENLRNRARARTWLLNGGKDFEEVCHMAMVDPEAVRSRAQALSRQGWPEPPAMARRMQSFQEAA